MTDQVAMEEHEEKGSSRCFGIFIIFNYSIIFPIFLDEFLNRIKN